jgi:hypothetical protein
MKRLALCSAVSRWSSPEWLSPSLTLHQLQHLLFELLAAQVPAPPQRLERFLGDGLQPAPFHLPLELLTSRCGVLPNHNDMATVYLHEGVHEDFMFALKAARPGWFIVPGTLIGGGKEDMPQFLKGIVQSACLWACPDVGFQHEQS